MNQLREFAQHSKEFEALDAKVVGLSVDDQEHSQQVWDKVTGRQFPILMDPERRVIREYGLLHAKGHGDEDIAIRTTFVVDPQGRIQWQKVSKDVFEVPKSSDVLEQLKRIQTSGIR
jgi:peroxiredoxin